MIRKGRTQRIALGDLIVELFEASKSVSDDELEREVLVWAALADLLNKHREPMQS